MRVLPASILLFSLAFQGCSLNLGKKTESDHTADPPRIATSAAETISAYPDTLYPSAAVVVFKVEQPDSTSGEISPLSDLYASAPGAFTFRKGQHRDAGFGGTVDSIPARIDTDWIFHTRQDFTPTEYGEWGGGTGWTGQPLYVEWPDSSLKRFRRAGMGAAQREIIVGSLCGDIYCIDYETGKLTRDTIATGNPIKGTMSLDPTLNGNLYVGQGIPTENPMRALTIDLFSNSITHATGPDPKAYRGWHAYDSSPVRVGQFLFRPGENGTLYKYRVAPGRLRLHSALRYRVNGAAPGMEASMAVSRNYGYIGDNHGNVICVNLNNMQPVWRYKLPDDDDSTPVVCEEGGKPYVYVGCEVEHAGVEEALYVKLDGLTGKPVWVNRTQAERTDVGSKHFDGGFYSSALPGKADCADLIFVNVVNNIKGRNGCFMAIDRATGKTRYATPLSCYAWSSPVGFTTGEGKYIVVTFDCAGYGYIIDGTTGRVLYTRHIGNNFESSPVVIANTLVIGSRGSEIYRLSLK